MDTQELIDALTGDGGDPGHPVSPVEKLRLLNALSRRADDLAGQLSTEIVSPTQAALFAHMVERTHRLAEFTQVRAAHTAQRTLVQDLPEQNLEQARAIADHPDAFIHGRTTLLADPATVPTGLMPFKDTTAFLQGALGLSHFAARDRLHAANSLLPHTDIHGNTCGPRYPKLAEQVQAGTARVGATAAAARKLDKLAHPIAAHPEMPGLAGRLEEQVAESVAAGFPGATNRLLNALADELDNATDQEPSPDEIRAKAGIFVTKRTRHYTWMSICMLNADAEVFYSHFAASGNPRTLAGNREAMATAATGMTPAIGAIVDGNGATTAANAADTADGPDWFTRPDNAENDILEAPAPGAGDPINSTVPGPDGLTPPQRHLQTLLNLMRAPNKPPGKGTTGLPTAQLVIHCRLETLLGLAKGAGWSAHGLEIPVGEVRRRLATDGVIPMVLGGQSEILDLGQEMRLAPDYIRRAILARDGGCFYPGCTVPPELLEMCHIDGYAQGGHTSVTSMTGGCSRHHHMADNGLLTLLLHNGLPHVVLPKHLDPEQLPRRNAFWQRPEATLF